MLDLTRQEKKVIIALSLFAVLGLSVLAYRTYFARPELKVVHSGFKSGAPGDYEKIIKGRSEININTADASKIETLPGVGPKIANGIVTYRTEHGLFLFKEDLMKVEGIGRNKFDAIRDLIILE